MAQLPARLLKKALFLLEWRLTRWYYIPMLESLKINNVAIVETLSVDFGKGLNVITGETGAGKSILIGALGLVLGERADKTMIRTGAEQCGIEAVFSLPDPSQADSILESAGLPPTEEGQLIVRRTVSSSGTGRILVNDSSTTLAVLKSLGNCLVDMHGPHDHQSILDQDAQMDLLDAFGRHHKARSTWEDLYRRWMDLKAKRRALDGDDESITREIESLSFQVKELEDARFSENEEEDLLNEHKLSANAKRVLELSQEIRTILTEGDNPADQLLSSVHRAVSELSKITPDADPWQNETETIISQMRELSRSISDYAGRVDADPERLQLVEDRLALIHKLRRKHGGSLKDILQKLSTWRERLASLVGRGESIARADAEIASVEGEMRRCGAALRKQRLTTAKTLAAAIGREMRDLGLPHAEFSVALSESDPSPSGIDTVDFGFAPNVGEAMRPLRAIASSGEVSRVMLAAKSVLANHDRVPVLVFDEIDANLGGETANAVGDKLSHVARHHQVLCITHLPQVAVHGSRHLRVFKEIEKGRTFTRVEPVDDTARVEEIARMLGGRDLTTVALRHAREMLRKS